MQIKSNQLIKLLPSGVLLLGWNKNVQPPSPLWDRIDKSDLNKPSDEPICQRAK